MILLWGNNLSSWWSIFTVSLSARRGALMSMSTKKWIGCHGKSKKQYEEFVAVLQNNNVIKVSKSTLGSITRDFYLLFYLFYFRFNETEQWSFSSGILFQQDADLAFYPAAVVRGFSNFLTRLKNSFYSESIRT